MPTVTNTILAQQNRSAGSYLFTGNFPNLGPHWTVRLDFQMTSAQVQNSSNTFTAIIERQIDTAWVHLASITFRGGAVDVLGNPVLIPFLEVSDCSEVSTGQPLRVTLVLNSTLNIGATATMIT